MRARDGPPRPTGPPPVVKSREWSPVRPGGTSNALQAPLLVSRCGKGRAAAAGRDTCGGRSGNRDNRQATGEPQARAKRRHSSPRRDSDPAERRPPPQRLGSPGSPPSRLRGRLIAEWISKEDGRPRRTRRDAQEVPGPAAVFPRLSGGVSHRRRPPGRLCPTPRRPAVRGARPAFRVSPVARRQAIA